MTESRTEALTVYGDRSPETVVLVEPKALFALQIVYVWTPPR